MRASDSFLVLASDRRSDRRAVRMQCELVRERDFRHVGSRVLDLSMHGMLVETDARVLTGEPVIVSFRAPKSDSWIDAEGIVARVVHGRRGSGDKRALGISLESLDTHSKAALIAGLRRVPPIRSKRGPRVDYAATIRGIGRY
ncbi:MAG: PilZ domain-containing protein [Polyangiales bacterium]